MRTAEAVRMMETKGVVRLKPEDANLGALKRFARYASEQDVELVFEFSGDIPPERVVKLFDWAGEEFKVQAIVRHAELKEYVTSAVAGAGVGAAGLGLLAYFAGVPVTWPIILGGAAAGALMGLLTTPLHIKIYKVRGRTRMRLAPSAA